MQKPQPQEVRASLGCGTLILIAIIVILFSGHKDHDKLERSVDRLNAEVTELRRELVALREELARQGAIVPSGVQGTRSASIPGESPPRPGGGP
jgi:hypothetical protein